VAVVVDGVYAPGPDGKPAYAPRQPAEIERIAALVRSAVGFDKGRGDQIEVVNLRFAEGPAGPQTLDEPSLVQSLLSPSKDDVMRIGELAVLTILTLIVLMTVVRPLVRQVLAPPGDGPTGGRSLGDILPAGATLTITGAGAAAAGGASAAIAADRNSPTAQLMEFAKVNGQVQAETVQRVVDMVRASPAETVEVLRAWIHEE
jgi:flagellar M-ring protein FliF